MDLNQEQISSIVRRAVEECLCRSTSRQTAHEDPYALFHSPEVRAVKEEIIKAGRKLWSRQYVDGNGGNISARVSPNYVLCTPTLCSKGDLSFDDLSLVNLENEQVCGDRPQTSEIKLHLEIYKSAPQATAVIHCHPPYATAHAIAGVVPQGSLIPEQEIFVGPVALSSYETPGTQKFAETIRPFARQHNTILLRNHGIVCWADSVTHAEWYVEVAETYCKTVMIASQLKSPLPEIPPEKIADLLEIKRKLGLPDARFTSELESPSAGDHARYPFTALAAETEVNASEIEEFVSFLTSQVVDFLSKKV